MALHKDAMSSTTLSVAKARQRLGENMRAVRERADIGPTELGRRMGCPRQMIQQWERGDNVPRIGSMMMFCVEVEATLAELYDGVLEQYVGDR